MTTDWDLCVLLARSKLLVRKTRQDWDRRLSRPCRRLHKLSIEVRAPESTQSHPKEYTVGTAA